MRWWLVTALLLAGGVGETAAATRYDPALRFRSLATPHFVIHFHAGEEAMAQRLARIAEAIHEELTARLGGGTRGRTHVVLVDQHDVAGGWATPVPYNLIEISAAPPPASSLLGHTNDWLRLVFTHEYAHVLHLDRSRGWASAARTLFGRVPFALPNLSLPVWQIEGLATFEESHDGDGRLHARDFEAIVRRAARADRFEPLDRVGGGLVDWPGGHAPYAYGARFHAFLATRYGRERLRTLADATSGRLPYLTAGVFTRVFGHSLRDLWEEFRAAERAAADRTASDDATRLTHGGFVRTGPRFDRDGTIVYSRSDPHGWPAVERIARDGGAVERLATRIGGEQIALARDALYFDQLELRRSVAAVSDLYRLDRGTGAVTRVTDQARLLDPDVSPDGTRIAAVRLDGERRTLVLLAAGHNRAERATAIDGPSCARPKWAPDGRRIAAECHVAGISNIAVFDLETGAWTVISPAPGRSLTPAWSPDGRVLVFASDRDGDFAIYRASADDNTAPERIVAWAGGAYSPDVAPDGRTIVFVGYTAEGFDLFTAPYDPGPGVAPTTATDAIRIDTGTGDEDEPSAMLASTAPYRAWSTVGPRAWLPVVERDDHQWEVGAATGGTDALGYHSWGLTATVPVARAAPFTALPRATRLNFHAAYVYDRWRPSLYVQIEDDTTPLLAGRGTADERAFSLHDHSVAAGIVFPLRRMRWTQTLTGAWRIERRIVETVGHRITETRGAARAGWGIFTARRFGYSISPERGLHAGAGAEIARRALGSDTSALYARGDLRAYVPAAPRHAVLALRAAAAAARGDRGGRRVLRLGGPAGDPGVLSLAEDAGSLLRGFPSDAFQGDSVALLNAEYRVPLAWPQRGLPHVPIFARALHASLFADAGHAWHEGEFHAADVKWSWGAELSTDLVLGHWLPLTATVGAGWGRDGAGLVPDNRQLYFRVGHGF